MSDTEKKTKKRRKAGSKIDLKNHLNERVLFIVDVNRLASTEFVSLETENRTKKPSHSAIIHDEVYNTSILYELFRRMLKVPLNSVDYAFAFDTPTNGIKAFNYRYGNGLVLEDNEYYGQINALRYVLKSSRFTVLEQDGYEAYNLIDKCVKDNYDYYDKIFIFTIDRVLYPLVDQKVNIVVNQSVKDDITPFTYEDALGVPYNLLQLKQCVVGDPKLSTKGVRLVGPKKFVQMIQRDNLLRIIPNSLTTKELIMQSKFLSEKQKIEALDELSWLLRRDGTYCDTRILKGNQTTLNSYLELFGLQKFIER